MEQSERDKERHKILGERWYLRRLSKSLRPRNEWLEMRLAYERRPQRIGLAIIGAAILGLSLWATSESYRPAILLTYLVIVAIFLIASAE